MGLFNGLRVRRTRTGDGKTKYSYRKRRSERYDRSKDVFDWTDADFEFYEIRKMLILPNILLLLLIFACSFATINDLVGKAVIPYLYVSGIICVICYLVTYTLLTTWIYLVVLIIYGGITIVSSLIFIAVRLFTECTQPYCLDNFTNNMVWILVTFGLGISAYYIIYGIIQCRRMHLVLRLRDKLNGDDYVEIDTTPNSSKIGGRFQSKKKRRKRKKKKNTETFKRSQSSNIPICKSTDTKRLLTEFDMFNMT